jgi:hypothetical protein
VLHDAKVGGPVQLVFDPNFRLTEGAEKAREYGLDRGAFRLHQADSDGCLGEHVTLHPIVSDNKSVVIAIKHRGRLWISGDYINEVRDALEKQKSAKAYGEISSRKAKDSAFATPWKVVEIAGSSNNSAQIEAPLGWLGAGILGFGLGALGGAAVGATLARPYPRYYPYGYYRYPYWW